MCDLVKFVSDLREAVLNFKLDLCCFVFSVRTGILLFGYFNVISSMVCLIAVATGVLPPLLMNAQQSFMDGEYIKSTCAFAYSADLCLAVLLLCAMYRRDIILLRYYTYCGMAMLASTVLVYSMVIGVLSVLHTCMLVLSLTHQIYIILLVRSVMVQLKHKAVEQSKYYSEYPVYWKLNDNEAPTYYNTEDTYETNTITSKNTPKTTATEIPSKPTPSEPVKDTVVPINSQAKDSKPIISDPVIDKTKPTINEAVKEDQPKATKETTLRYPYKFIAIKVPKEEPIKEEKESEDKEKETDKSEIVKEETTKTTKEPKKRKRSIFGRKIKSKSEDDKKDETEKN